MSKKKAEREKKMIVEELLEMGIRHTKEKMEDRHKKEKGVGVPETAKRSEEEFSKELSSSPSDRRRVKPQPKPQKTVEERIDFMEQTVSKLWDERYKVDGRVSALEKQIESFESSRQLFNNFVMEINERLGLLEKAHNEFLGFCIHSGWLNADDEDGLKGLRVGENKK